MERAVSNLPDKHRVAIRWAYVHTWKPPMLVARRLAVSPATLQDLIHDGRSMLNNRL
jgi:DNA-directed RNA polymerase specialized sigma24 family protein